MARPNVRCTAFPLVLGAATGALLVGLVLPLAVGERPATPTQASSVPPLTAASGTPAAPLFGTGAGPTSPGSPTGPADATVGADAPLRDQRAAAARAAAGGGAPSGNDVVLGIVLLEAGGLDQVGQAIGLPSARDQETAARAYVDEINERGGIVGRRLKAAFATVDVLDQASERAACLALVQDAEAFTVVGTFVSQSGQLCVTQEHRRPLVSPGLVAVDESFERSGGLLFTLHQRASRLVANMVALAEPTFAGRAIGVVTSDAVDPRGEVAARAAALLRAAGHETTETVRLSSDLSVAASQMPIEVRRMQASGAEVVVLLAPGLLSTQFVQQAERQRYLPAYVATDFGPMSPDSSVQNMPQSFDGATLVTATNGADSNVGAPPNGDERGCRAILEKRTALRYEQGSNAAGLTAGFCAAVATAASGIRSAGADLTAERFSVSLQTAPKAPLMSPAWGGGEFKRGKFDLADLVRIDRFSFGCRCWRPAGPFRAPAA